MEIQTLTSQRPHDEIEVEAMSTVEITRVWPTWAVREMLDQLQTWRSG